MRIKNTNMSTVQLIDVDQLLLDSLAEAHQKLLDNGFSAKEINVCVNGRPFGRYSAFVDEQHPLLFDYQYRYEVALIQHANNLKNWLSTEGESARE